MPPTFSRDITAVPQQGYPSTYWQAVVQSSTDNPVPIHRLFAWSRCSSGYRGNGNVLSSPTLIQDVAKSETQFDDDFCDNSEQHKRLEPLIVSHGAMCASIVTAWRSIQQIKAELPHGCFDSSTFHTNVALQGVRTSQLKHSWSSPQPQRSELIPDPTLKEHAVYPCAQVLHGGVLPSHTGIEVSAESHHLVMSSTYKQL